ncbi:unnamed protein product [Hymenolepis diminuta]|uniref:Transmembrane protein n=1 Tax=Hymenolepis diminuta TaxID=6216 RepID=A0A0R3SK30_HYMDI|nr:unnamed protein product [Hymenolepis diminuta]
MGVQSKLEEIEVMEQDPPPLSEIKTGYTPTTSASATDIAHDYSRYENLDTPTPIRSSDIMAYTTRFDLSKYSASLSFCLWLLCLIFMLI